MVGVVLVDERSHAVGPRDGRHPVFAARTPRLWTAAKLFHPRDQSSAEAFVREQVQHILDGQVNTVIQSLRSRATRRELSKEKKTKLEVICHYFAKNAKRMRYHEYLRQGYPIASGVIEGACRHVVKDRLERTGMIDTPWGPGHVESPSNMDLRSMRSMRDIE